MKNNILLCLICILLTSCYNSELVDPNRLSANVKISVYGKNNEPVNKAKVIISYSNSIVESYSTNSNGEFQTHLLEGFYIVSTSYFIDSINFDVSKAFNVIACNNNTCEIRPFENQGFLKFSITNKLNKPQANLKVTLLYKSPLKNNQSYQYYKMYSYVSGMTDKNGHITFNNIPLVHNFSVLLEIDESQFVFINEVFQSYKKGYFFGYRITWPY